MSRAGQRGERTVEDGGRVRSVWVRVAMSFVWSRAKQRGRQRGRKGQRRDFLNQSLYESISALHSDVKIFYLSFDLI